MLVYHRNEGKSSEMQANLQESDKWMNFLTFFFWQIVNKGDGRQIERTLWIIPSATVSSQVEFYCQTFYKASQWEGLSLCC